eukprot:Em0009g1004a
MTSLNQRSCLLLPSFSMTTESFFTTMTTSEASTISTSLTPSGWQTCLLRDSKRFPSQFFQQYLQLLERFEIALSLGNGQRLIPSMLPVHKPDLNLPELSPRLPPKPKRCPASGGGLMEDNQPTESNLTYWRRGILVNHASGRFLVESAQPLTSEISGAAVSTLMEASVMYVGDGVDGAVSAENHGVDITVWSTADDFSAMGYIVDELDSLIDEWFPALGEIGWYDDALIDQLLWAARFEKLRAVRAEACHTLGVLGVNHNRVVRTLKEMIIFEEDDLVIREVRGVLEKLGHDTHVEDDALEMIRAEVSCWHRAIHQDHHNGLRKSSNDRLCFGTPEGVPSTRDYLNDTISQQHCSV